MTAAPTDYYAKGLYRIGAIDGTSVFVDVALNGFTVLRGKRLYLRYKYPTVIDLAMGRIISSKNLEFKSRFKPSYARVSYSGVEYFLGEKHGT